MNVVIWITIGLIAGWLIANFVKHSSRTLIDIIFAIVGSIFGAFIANGVLGISSTSFYTFVAGVIGAVIFIFLGRLRTIAK